MPRDYKSTEITLADAVAITGYTKTTIHKLVASGFISKAARGTYVLGDVVAGVIKNLNSQRKASTQTTAQMRIQKARAIEIEIRNARAIGRVVELEEVLAAFDDAFVPIKIGLEGLGAQITRDPELRRKIDKATNDLMDQFSIKRVRAETSMRIAEGETEDGDE